MLQVSSVWLTLAFTVDRYIMICHPFRAERFCTVSRARRVVAALVISSVVFNIPKFFEYHTVVFPVPVKDVEVVGCDLTAFGRSRVFKQLYHSWLYIVFVFGIPFVSLVVFNAFLVNAVRVSRQRSRELRTPSRRRNTSTHLVDNAAPAYQLEGHPRGFLRCCGREKRAFRPAAAEESSRSWAAYQLEGPGGFLCPDSREKWAFRLEENSRSWAAAAAAYQLEGVAGVAPPVTRSPSPVSRRIDTTVMLIGVVIIFIVCQFPALVSRIIWAFADNSSRAFSDLPLYALNETANFLVLLNSSVNIVPYYFFGRRFRRQFLALFCPYCGSGRRAARGRARSDSAANDSVGAFSHFSARAS